MTCTVGIIDYGLSNLACVRAAVERLGYRAIVGGTPDVVEASDKVIVPGVGAFGDAMNNLHQQGLVEPLNRYVRDGSMPFLGICLGAQLVTRQSDEFGHHAGLAWVDAEVRRLEPGADLRVPHTGWDDIRQLQDCPLLLGIPDGSLFYYTHSHGIFCDDSNAVVADCNYGQSIASIIRNENIYATQFHPEKSQRSGLILLNNFLKLA